MRLPLLLFAAAAWPSLAVAQPQPPATTGPADVKVNQLIVYGEDPCPQSTNDEITVCARLPDEERFRIPPNLRDNPNDPANTSWTEKAQRLELAGRTGIGSCSPVGPGAGAGCLNQLIRGWAEETGNDGVDWTRLVEEARQERLGQIDAKSDAIERELEAEGR